MNKNINLSDYEDIRSSKNYKIEGCSCICLFQILLCLFGIQNNPIILHK